VGDVMTPRDQWAPRVPCDCALHATPGGDIKTYSSVIPAKPVPHENREQESRREAFSLFPSLPTTSDNLEPRFIEA
jgi:hypothetical protein